MSEATAVSLPWIPRDDAREKYEAKGDKQAYGEKSVTGTIAEVDSRENEYGTYLVVTLDVAGVGRVAIHAQPQVLDGQIRKVLNMKYGDEITVTYLGEVMGGAGRTYSNYQVITPIVVGAPIVAPAGFGAPTPAAPAAADGQPIQPSAPVQSQAADDDIPF